MLSDSLRSTYRPAEIGPAWPRAWQGSGMHYLTAHYLGRLLKISLKLKSPYHFNIGILLYSESERQSFAVSWKKSTTPAVRVSRRAPAR